MGVRKTQHGMTLVISLIMLVVLTLVVVAAIRFGNVNLRVAGNMQSEAEASAAAQVAIEQTIVDVVSGASKIDEIATHNVSVSTGAVTYTVVVSKPTCAATSNIPNSELDKDNVNDQPCFTVNQGPCIIDSSGECVVPPTSCRKQTWDIAASVDDSRSGAKVSLGQGVSMRVSAAVQCP